MELPRLWTRHVLNSAIAAPYFSGSAVDVGSGAGLPGLVLAIARPDVEWTLIEPMERRTAWLTEQVADLELDNVSVERMRGEEWSRGRVFDAATARAVSALRTLLPFTAPLVRPGGRLVFLKGANVAGEIDAAKPTRKASGSGGNPRAMPTRRQMSAVAKAGNQPECIAAIPDRMAAASAATAA